MEKKAETKLTNEVHDELYMIFMMHLHSDLQHLIGSSKAETVGSEV